MRAGGSQRKIGVLTPGEVGRGPHSISGVLPINGTSISFPARLTQWTMRVFQCQYQQLFTLWGFMLDEGAEKQG